jgi:large subunit ribosomal protein L37Ae
MAKRTKKVGSAGRFGARYGVRIRKRIADVERVSKIWHECPKCMAAAVKRQANGIWVCRHCGAQLASSSYVLTAPVEGPKETEKTPEPAEEELKER